MPHGARGYRTGGGDGGGGDGTINFREDHDLGLGDSATVADFTSLRQHDVGLGAVTVAELLSEQSMALGVTQQVAGTVIPTTDTALASTTVADMTNLREAVAASAVTRFTVDFTRAGGATSVAETAVGGRTDWEDDTNATGNPDASSATIAGSALGGRGGQLEFGHAVFTGKDDLTLGTITLRFYVEQAGTILNNGDLQLKWRKVSTDAWTVLETITGDVANLVTPRDFDITSSYTTPVLSDLDTIETAVSFSAAVTQLYTAACDAVEVDVSASLTEAL